MAGFVVVVSRVIDRSMCRIREEGHLVDEAPLHGPVPLPVAARDLRELPLLPNPPLVLSAVATAPGLLARERPRMFPVSAVWALDLRRGFDAGLPADARAARPVALAARSAREIHR